MPNINDTYFDGHYKQIWKSIIPDELTVKETDFMMQYFKLRPGNRVLDLMCGYGRHSLALAAKGMEVTAVDNLPDYINDVRNNAEAENLNVHPLLNDVMLYKPEGNFDLAICMGNSLQFFDKAEVMQLLKKISTHLNTGGYFLVNTWTIMEIVVKNFREKSWSMNGDLKFLVDSKFYFSPNRIETEHQIITPDGTTEIKQSVDYIWSLNEMETMLADSGMKMTEVFSIPGRKKFTLGEPRAYIVAQKS
jgi:cyclopropane fatty-acyl-phospholipid synthase-like methyltransferase